MTNYDREQRDMDEMTVVLRRASAMQTIGYFLLFFAAIPACFIWVGFRSGSNFWLYWTIVEGVVGLGLVAAATSMRDRMGQYLPRPLDTTEEAVDSEDVKRVA